MNAKINLQLSKISIFHGIKSLLRPLATLVVKKLNIFLLRMISSNIKQLKNLCIQFYQEMGVPKTDSRIFLTPKYSTTKIVPKSNSDAM